MSTLEELTPEQQANIVKRAKVLQSLLDNPEISAQAKRLIMKADPSVKFPDVIAADAVKDDFKEQNKKIEDLEKELIRQSAEANLEKRRQEARDAGVDPADVEKAITEQGIGKWETAIKFVQLTQQSAVPTSYSAGNSTPVPGKDDKEFWQDPAKWANKTAHETIDELRGRARPRLAAVK